MLSKRHFRDGTEVEVRAALCRGEEAVVPAGSGTIKPRKERKTQLKLPGPP